VWVPVRNPVDPAWWPDAVPAFEKPKARAEQFCLRCKMARRVIDYDGNEIEIEDKTR